MGWGPTEKGREVGVGTKPSGYGGSLSSFRPDASSPPQIHSETKGGKVGRGNEGRERKGEKQRKEACIRIGERKKEALLWLSAQTLPRCLRRRRRRLPLGVENPFNSKLFSYSRGLLFPLFSPFTLFFPFIFASIHMEIKDVP